MIAGMANIQGWFPTFIYNAPLARIGLRAFNRDLLKECRQIRNLDEAGRKWCVKNYPGGYTSYASMDNLHQVSSTFATLERRIRRHVARFVAHLELNVETSQLAMTDCWVNMMPSQVAHSMHLHPLSLISGTYYVNTPPGSPAIKFEDPRLDRFMFAPPRKDGARPENQQIVRHAANAGNVILFESWLRHEVEAGNVRGERVSISFNYTWR